MTPNRGRRSCEHDPTTGEIVSIAFRDGGENGTAALSHVPDIDLDFGHAFRRTHRIRDDDPLSANCELVQRSVSRRTGWLAQVDCHTELTADANQFRVRATLSASQMESRSFRGNGTRGCHGDWCKRAVGVKPRWPTARG